MKTTFNIKNIVRDFCASVAMAILVVSCTVYSLNREAEVQHAEVNSFKLNLIEQLEAEYNTLTVYDKDRKDEIREAIAELRAVN